MDEKLRIGVLALQGAFVEHVHILKRLPEVGEVITVRTQEQLESIDALVIPGGESTAIALIAERCGLLEPLRKFVRSKPTWGTCAGMILLANEASKTKKGGQQLLGGLDIAVNRNQFGSQRDSFETNLHMSAVLGENAPPFHAVFIRAPVITALNSEEIKVLAKLEQQVGQTDAETVVAVRQGHLMATAFHPELTSDDRLHRYFINLAQAYKGIANESIPLVN
ncbi:PdxT/SNO family [Endogone sp. FLAS-F59071]|nr:PdxT/SNO family [Endogone sp. FLAS-F59071]|eukprot:RUS21285.1 PdxT/SNO family [Endogone sp. FLAS-F59071]